MTNSWAQCPPSPLEAPKCPLCDHAEGMAAGKTLACPIRGAMAVVPPGVPGAPG